MNLPQALQHIYRYIEVHKTSYVQILREAVAIPSVSVAPSRRDDCIKMMRWTEKKFRKLGAETELCDIGIQELPNGGTIKCPPVLTAVVGHKTGKNRHVLLVYGHMDVVAPEEGWETEPFNLVEKEGKLYGRGAVDDKGPMMCWLNAIEAYQATKTEIPINIKFIIEGMREVGSEGLRSLLQTKKKTFLNNVNFVCINDTSWASLKKPSVSYGTRGLLYFSVSVEGLSKDLHSGEYGGAVVEPLADLIFLMNSMQDHNGHMQIPGLNEFVLQVTPEEERLYKSVTLDVEEMRREVGAVRLAHKEDKLRLLMHRWRFPSLSYHGIEGAYSGSGGKNVIPAKVVGKFSVRLVQHMQAESVTKNITEYLEKVFKLRKSPNRLDIKLLESVNQWSENPLTPHYSAAMKAVKHVYQVEPDVVREGSTLPICNMLHEMTEGKSLLLLPLGTRADGAHAPNEKMDIKRYILGTKVIAGYIYELSLI